MINKGEKNLKNGGNFMDRHYHKRNHHPPNQSSQPNHMITLQKYQEQLWKSERYVLMAVIVACLLGGVLLWRFLAGNQICIIHDGIMEDCMDGAWISLVPFVFGIVGICNYKIKQKKIQI